MYNISPEDEARDEEVKESQAREAALRVYYSHPYADDEAEEVYRKMTGRDDDSSYRPC